jgi:hypothetical protein
MKSKFFWSSWGKSTRNWTKINKREETKGTPLSFQEKEKQ